LVNQPLGLSPHGVLVLGSAMSGGQDRSLWYQVADHLRSVSGVQNAAVMGFALMSGTGWNGNVWANGHGPEGNPETWFLSVSPTWMDTMKIPLLEGRQIRPDDLFPRVAIVNRTFAKRYFENQSPVGKTLDLNVGAKRVTAEIIGVAADARYTGMREPIDPTLYVPFRSSNEQGASPFQSGATFVVRTNQSNPLSLAGVFRQEIQRARAGFRVANIQTQDELDDSQTVREQLLARLSVFFGGLALLLAGLGLYGVLSYAVTQRLREFGIRIALGARAPHIAGRIALPVTGIIAAGAAVGLAVGVSVERFFRTILFGVRATDPGMLSWAIFAISAAAALSAVPAVVKALRIDAATLLRTD